jgi:non-specific serine/threonine protein kinase
MIGKAVSHYKILEKIGEGGMGEVFVAEDTKLRRKVALKFLPADLTQDASRKQRFLQEARAAASLEHPHIAAVYDIDEIDGRTFMAMEYVRGKSLREIILKNTLSLRRSLELGTQIAEGLAKAHERGIVHRDLKPENVLVSDDGYAKIIDFGLAKLGEPVPAAAPECDGEHEAEILIRTREGLVLGTVAYMSPEQARAQSVDARTDVFSLGVLLQEMLTGQAPFSRGSVAETLSAILKESPPELPAQVTSATPELQDALRKALAKNPEERYARMKDLASDLRTFREELGSAARPPVAPRAGRLLQYATLALIVLGLAGAAAYLGREHHQPGIGSAGRPAIAVMYFEDNTGSEEIRWLSNGLPNMLLTDLAQTPGLDVVSRQRILEVLKQIGADDLESLDASLVLEVARRAGAGAVVGGSIYEVGDSVRIDVQVEDLASGRILSAHSVTGDDVFPLVDELSGRIRASLEMTDAPADRSITEVTTDSLEAYRLYSEGIEARRNLRGVDARNRLERAIQIDPSFAMAYYELAQTPERVGEAGKNEEYMDKVLELVDRLPERQRLRVEATAATKQDHDPERAQEILETLVARYPDEEDGYHELSKVYFDRNEVERATEILERGVAANPDSGMLRNHYGYQLLETGRYREAVEQFEIYAALKPDEPNPHDSLAESYLITGQPEKALEQYARALEVDPTFFASHGGRAWAYSMMGRYQECLEELAKSEAVFVGGKLSTAGVRFARGFVLSRLGHYREAEDQIRRGIHEAGEADESDLQADLLLLRAQVAIELGDYPLAVESVSEAEELFDDEMLRSRREMLAHLLAGAAEARGGNPDTARKLLKSQEDVYHPDDLITNRWPRALAGEIALAAGDLAAAEEAFRAAEPEHKAWFSNGHGAWSAFSNNHPFRDGLARTKEAQGDLTGAIALYRALLTPSMDSKWTAALEPRYVLALARLLEESGDETAARQEYQRFLDLWKGADPDLPELKDASGSVE